MDSIADADVEIQVLKARKVFECVLFEDEDLCYQSILEQIPFNTNEFPSPNDVLLLQRFYQFVEMRRIQKICDATLMLGHDATLEVLLQKLSYLQRARKINGDYRRHLAVFSSDFTTRVSLNRRALLHAALVARACSVVVSLATQEYLKDRTRLDIQVLRTACDAFSLSTNRLNVEVFTISPNQNSTRPPKEPSILTEKMDANFKGCRLSSLTCQKTLVDAQMKDRSQQLISTAEMNAEIKCHQLLSLLIKNIFQDVNTQSQSLKAQSMPGIYSEIKCCRIFERCERRIRQLPRYSSSRTAKRTPQSTQCDYDSNCIPVNHADVRVAGSLVTLQKFVKSRLSDDAKNILDSEMQKAQRKNLKKRQTERRRQIIDRFEAFMKRKGSFEPEIRGVRARKGSKPEPHMFRHEILEKQWCEFEKENPGIKIKDKIAGQKKPD